MFLYKDVFRLSKSYRILKSKDFSSFLKVHGQAQTTVQRDDKQTAHHETYLNKAVQIQHPLLLEKELHNVVHLFTVV